MSISAGRLNRRIVIERATETANDYGEAIQTWGEYATLWAERRDVSDGEMIAAGELGAYLAARFTVRRSSVTEAITPRDRLRHEGAVWNIQAVRERHERQGDAHIRPKTLLEIRAVRAI